jgi:hypothetical protein
MPRDARGLSAGWLAVCGTLLLLAAGGCAETPAPAPQFPSLPPLAPAPPVVGDITGSAPPGPIRDIVRGRIGQIKHCFDEGQRRNRALSGKVVLHWLIAPTGLPYDILFASSTLPDEEVNLCLARHIAFWEFPPHGGAPVDVFFPFDF